MSSTNSYASMASSFKTSGPSTKTTCTSTQASCDDANWIAVGKGGKAKSNKPKTKSGNNYYNNNQNEQNNYNCDTITINKKTKNTVKVDKLAKNNTTPNSTTYFDSRKARKLEELHEEGDFTLERSSKKLQTSIINGRNTLKLNQEEFAKLCNIQVGILRSYERGTLVPTNEHLNIMSRKLGVTLTK